MVRFRWRQQFQRRYPDEFLDKSNARYEYLRLGIIYLFWLFKIDIKESDHKVPV